MERYTNPSPDLKPVWYKVGIVFESVERLSRLAEKLSSNVDGVCGMDKEKKNPTSPDELLHVNVSGNVGIGTPKQLEGTSPMFQRLVELDARLNAVHDRLSDILKRLEI